MTKQNIVALYARMWPRAVFSKVSPKEGGKKSIMAKSFEFLNRPGVYILYRDHEPYYIGQAKRLYTRLWLHAVHVEHRYFHFWNFFSAFAIDDPKQRSEIEGILIAAMPTANSARPRLKRQKMPKQVSELLRRINQ